MSSVLHVLAGAPDIENDVRTVDGAQIHARHLANPGAPPVVLVHGMAVSSRYFVPTMRELGGVADVWAPDLVGHGRSDRGPGVPILDDLSENLLAWMSAAELPPAVLVGNSFGCQIAVEAARRAPAAVRALVLNGPTTDPQARSAAELLARWLRTSVRESPLQLPLLALDYLQFGPVRAARMVGGVLDDAVEEKLPHLTMPVVVVTGTEDPIVPRDWAEEVVRLLPQGRLVLVPGAAHTVNFTHPTQLAAAVTDVSEIA